MLFHQKVFMKKLSLSIQTFSKLIKSNCVYVDKTEHIYNLIQGDCYFFSRPRRFGKSILCSTLKELFLGEKDTFKELWISTSSSYAWPKHPVIYIDFLLIHCRTTTGLTASLMRYLNEIAKDYGLKELAFTTPGEMLKDLTITLYRIYGSDNGVVLIIDEYDKPILDHLDNPSLAEEMRQILKDFYIFIKGLDEYLRFVFITGVSRFSKTSIFSGLNQLVDITMEPQFAHLVGYTEAEINYFFDEHLEQAAHYQKLTRTEFSDTLRLWYNGYRFWKNLPLRLLQSEETIALPRLYAPFSILHVLYTCRLENYWIETATPAFLIDLLKNNSYPSDIINKLKADIEELATFDPTDIPLTTLLFQTGYLTIKTYDAESRNYLLEVPNNEVSESLSKYILNVVTGYKANQINDYLNNLYKEIEGENLEKFITELKNFYVKVPYTITIDQEKYYQSILFVLLNLLTIKIDVERATNIGRIDMVVETTKTIYIFELKLNKSAQEAIEQIKTKKYYERYVGLSKKIILVGINFSSKEKNIESFLFEELSSGRMNT